MSLEFSHIVENIKRGKYGLIGVGFYEDLVEHFELDPKDPKTLKMYSLAWENGRDGGMMEVFYHMKDLVGIFKS